MDVGYAASADAVADANAAWEAGDRRLLMIMGMSPVAPRMWDVRDIHELDNARFIEGSSHYLPTDEQMRKEFRADEYAELYNLVILLRSRTEAGHRPAFELIVDAARDAVRRGDLRIIETTVGPLEENYLDGEAWERVQKRSAASVLGKEPEPRTDEWLCAAMYNLIIIRALPDDVRFADQLTPGTSPSRSDGAGR